MNHEHHHKNVINSTRNDKIDRNLLISALLNLSISFAEIIGGLFSNSLALISDALHNLGDTSALFIAYIANLIGKKNHNNKKTFGYKRIEILAALFNAIVLAVIIIFLFIEAYKRLKNPEPIKGSIMFVIAVIGFLGNLISVFLLRKHTLKNINVRAAYLHLLGDTVSSILVIITSIIIFFFNVLWIDPLITLILGLYLLRETFLIVKEAVDILMQSTPSGLDLQKVKLALEALPEIDNIHHVHAWNLSDMDIHFECHIDLKTDIRISETEKIKNVVTNILLTKFNINHVTIQYEYNCCDNKSMIHIK